KHLDMLQWTTTPYAKNKRTNFLMYMQTLVNSGLVEANIHNIVVDTVTTLFKKNWKNNTTQTYVEYEGFGKHDDLLNSGYIQENVKVIQEILNKVKDKEIFF